MRMLGKKRKEDVQWTHPLSVLKAEEKSLLHDELLAVLNVDALRWGCYLTT